MDKETLLIILGGLLLAVGIIGGGFSIKELVVPKVGMAPRVIAFAVGGALIAFGANLVDTRAPANTNVQTVVAPSEAPRPVETPTNLAINGTATQSTTDFGGDARRAIDGVTNGHYVNNASVTHTQNSPNSYWQVKLERPASITKIVLFNRSDCCAERLSNFRLSVLDGDREAFGLDVNGAVGQEQEFHVPTDTRGQTVRVQLKGVNRQSNGFLSLAEVQVFGIAR